MRAPVTLSTHHQLERVMKVTTKWVATVLVAAVILAVAGAGIASAMTAGAPSHSASQATSSHKSTAPKSTAPKNVRCPHGQTKSTGQAIYSDVQFPDTLSPDQTTEASTVETLDSMFDGLLGFNTRAQMFPDMLTQIPTLKNGGISKDGKTYIFRFKQGMTWSNGTPITSKDLAFGFAIDKDKVSGPICAAGCNVISRIDTPNNTTAVIRLKHVDAAFLGAGHYPEIWPRKWAGAWSNAHEAALKLYQTSSYNFEDKSYPTSGPYQVDSFVTNDRITLSPNPHYNIMACGPQIKSLIFSLYTNNEAMIAAAARHETNVTQDYTLANAAQLKSQKAFKTIVKPGFVIEHLELNQDKTYNGNPNPLANTKARQALALGVNKSLVLRSALAVSPATAKSVLGYSFLVATPTFKQPFATKLNGQWDPIVKKYVQSGSAQAVKDAKKLLSQAGYPHGFSVDFQTTTAPTTRTAEQAAICQNWMQIGVSCNMKQTPSSTLFSQWQTNGTLDHGQFQVALFAFLGGADPDPLKEDLMGRFIDRNQSVHTPINQNYSGVHDSTIDNAFTKAAATLNNAVRARYYAIAQTRVNQNADWIILYYRPVIATTDSHIKNVTDVPTQYGPEWNTWAWHL
jgi:peptide/nickel transport system substrate-binding protein